MYSSHSGTPVSGAVPVFAVSVLVGAVVVLLVVVVVDVVAVFAGLFAVVFALFVAPPPQPNEINAKHIAAAIAKKLLILIILKFLTEIVFSAFRSRTSGTKIKNIFDC